MTGAKVTLAAAWAGIGYWLGGWDASLQALAILMAADYLLGTIAAALGRSKGGLRLSSRTGLVGLGKKVAGLGIVLVANVVDMQAGTDIMRRLVLAFLLANEGISILENAAALGVPVPGPLASALQTMRDKAGSQNGIDGGGA